MKKKKKNKKSKGVALQPLLGIKSFTQYGLSTYKGELLFYHIVPTNISVLSSANIEIKIRHLMQVLSAVPNIELVCTDSSECFDDNKEYLKRRLDEENNIKVKKIISSDVEFLDQIQLEMATARQFLFIARFKNLKPAQVFQHANRIEKIISEQGFETHRMSKNEIKRFIALYFESSINGDMLPDVDGEQYFDFSKTIQEVSDNG